MRRIPRSPATGGCASRTRLGGICGSDLNIVTLKASPSTSPFSTFPFVLGHELVGEVIETGAAVKAVRAGDRVAANPLLCCESRAVSPVCAACASGDHGRCANFTGGALPAGMLIGTTRGIGGGWGEQFVAHESQLLKLSSAMTRRGRGADRALRVLRARGARESARERGARARDRRGLDRTAHHRGHPRARAQRARHRARPPRVPGGARAALRRGERHSREGELPQAARRRRRHEAAQADPRQADRHWRLRPHLRMRERRARHGRRDALHHARAARSRCSATRA